MSEVALPVSVSALDQVADHGDSESADTPSRGNTPQGDHEAVGANQAEQPSDAASTTENVSGYEGTGVDAENHTSPLDTPLGETPAQQTIINAGEAEHKHKPVTGKAVASKTKPVMSVKTPASRSNGGPPTPLVKRIINSGTFGAGSVKPPSTKTPTTAGTASVKPSSAAPVLKKSTSASSATSKPATATSRASTVPSAAPSRRLSVAPSKPTAPPLAKPSLSASASTKPPSSASATRASVVSPAGSAASSASRPRASVSEGVKRAPLTSRQSISTTTKPPPARSTGSVPAKSTRPTTSISSIREVREDGKALEEIQAKLKDATESLASKSEAVITLENQVGELNSSLESAMADAESKQSVAQGLGQEKSLLETQLKEATEALHKLEAEHHEAASLLKSVQQDLKSARSDAGTHNELAQNLQAQIRVLEAEVTSAKENLEALRVSTSSEASEAAMADRDALLKARADIKVFEDGAELLKANYTKAIQEAESQVKELQEKAALAVELSVQVAHLKEEKEENAGKLSELEIEILELKESQEVVEDERERSFAHVKLLEEQLVKEAAAAHQAEEEFKTKEADRATEFEKIENAHRQALQAASEEQDKLTSALEALRVELANSQAAQDEIDAKAQAAVKEHALNLEKAEQAYVQKQGELMEEIKRITTELESQEAYYNSKVDGVKEEHKQSLQEAFERAKNEAGEEHAQELQALRSTSSATIEQIQAMNKSALENLKSDHASALASEVKNLEKQINTLKLDLKATQDDLTKAKAALEVARADVESLTTQRDGARAVADSAPQTSPEHAEEVARLNKELSNRKDDLNAVTGVLDLTRASLAEVSNNQAKELEEAAKSRAEEVTKLRAAHDELVASLAAEKAALANSLSDAQGELATLKASVNSETAAPKSNGNGAVHPPSPGVTKEELQRMHEAHNLKIYDIQAEHEKAMKALRAELEASEDRSAELQQEVGRKAMEIQYLEQDQEESQEQITRLKEDVDTLTERLSKVEAISA